MITFKSDRVRNFCWIFIFPTLKLGSVVFQTPRGEADSQSPLAVGATAKPQQNALILAGGLHTCWEFAVTVGLLLDRAGFGVANRDFFIAAEKKKFQKIHRLQAKSQSVASSVWSSAKVDLNA